MSSFLSKGDLNVAGKPGKTVSAGSGKADCAFYWMISTLLGIARITSIEECLSYDSGPSCKAQWMDHEKLEKIGFADGV